MNSVQKLSEQSRQFRDRLRRSSACVLAAANVKVVATVAGTSSESLSTAADKAVIRCILPAGKGRISIVRTAIIQWRVVVRIGLAVICAILLTIWIQKHYIAQFYFAKGSGGAGPVVNCAREAATYVVAATLQLTAITSPPKSLTILDLTVSAGTRAREHLNVATPSLAFPLSKCCKER